MPEAGGFWASLSYIVKLHEIWSSKANEKALLCREECMKMSKTRSLRPHREAAWLGIWPRTLSLSILMILVQAGRRLAQSP